MSSLLVKLPKSSLLGLFYPESNLTNFKYLLVPWFWQRLGLMKHESITVRAKNSVVWYFPLSSCSVHLQKGLPVVKMSPSFLVSKWLRTRSLWTKKSSSERCQTPCTLPTHTNNNLCVMLCKRSTIFPEIIKQYFFFISERNLSVFFLFWPYSWAEWISMYGKSFVKPFSSKLLLSIYVRMILRIIYTVLLVFHAWGPMQFPPLLLWLKST